MENNTADNSPNSPVLSNCSSSTDQPPECGDFAAASSVCRFIFQPKFRLPSSLSSTPTSSTLSNDDNDDSIATMEPFNPLPQLEELEDQLRDLNKEIDSLHRENAQLRSANTDLLQRILNPSFFPNVDFMPLGGFGLADGSAAGSDEASSDVSPTSVIHRNQFIAGGHFSLSNLECPRQFVPESQKGEAGFHVIGRSSCGAADERVDNNNVIMKAYNQGMRKTELCNKWERSRGACPYGENCQFAHGMRELRPVVRHPSYKTKICRMILTRGTCPYGHRCHFRHSLNDQV